MRIGATVLVLLFVSAAGCHGWADQGQGAAGLWEVAERRAEKAAELFSGEDLPAASVEARQGLELLERFDAALQQRAEQ